MRSMGKLSDQGGKMERKGRQACLATEWHGDIGVLRQTDRQRDPEPLRMSRQAG